MIQRCSNPPTKSNSRPPPAAQLTAALFYILPPQSASSASCSSTSPFHFCLVMEKRFSDSNPHVVGIYPAAKSNQCSAAHCSLMQRRHLATAISQQHADTLIQVNKLPDISDNIRTRTINKKIIPRASLGAQDTPNAIKTRITKHRAEFIYLAPGRSHVVDQSK